MSASSTSTVTERVIAGKATRFEVHFPKGCHGLVKVRGFVNNTQIWPRNPSQFVSGDNETVVVESDYLIPSNSELKIQITNDDDTYSHTPLVRLDVQESFRVTDGQLPLKQNILADFKRPKPIPLLTPLLEFLAPKNNTKRGRL